MGFLGWISVSLTPSTFSIWDSAVKRSCLFLPIYSLISIPYLYQYSPLIFVRFFGGINHHSYYIFRCWTCPSFGFWKPNLLLLSLSLSLLIVSSLVPLLFWCILVSFFLLGWELPLLHFAVHFVDYPVFWKHTPLQGPTSERRRQVCTSWASPSSVAAACLTLGLQAGSWGSARGAKCKGEDAAAEHFLWAPVNTKLKVTQSCPIHCGFSRPEYWSG